MLELWALSIRSKKIKSSTTTCWSMSIKSKKIKSSTKTCWSYENWALSLRKLNHQRHGAIRIGDDLIFLQFLLFNNLVLSIWDKRFILHVHVNSQHVQMAGFHELMAWSVILYLYLRILHLLRISLSLGCKVFISASPRMQWYCRLVMKNSVLDS